MPAPFAVFKIAYSCGELPSEVQYGTAVVKHKDHCCKEKQAHDDVENAISLATRVFNFVHIDRQIFVVRKIVGQK